MKKLISGIFVILIPFLTLNAQYNTWTPTSMVEVPQGRGYFTAVSTGSKMIIWGGWNVFSGGGNLNTGGVYDPETDTWAPTSLINAPTGRNIHCAVWTGSRMIVWGGYGYDSLGTLTNLNTGGIYDPETDTWEATSTKNAPPPSGWATAVWTGSKMIVWGGNTAAGGVSTGGIYDPDTDSWELISNTNAPTSRTRHTAVWTGSKMIIWGGWGGQGTLPLTNTGGIYDPATNTWVATDTLTAPSPRYMHTAVWTGTKMIVFGGNPYINQIVHLHTGGIFDPITNNWQATDTLTAPPGRYEHSAVWTGRTMIVWGGSGARQTGGIYIPETNTWQLTDSINAPVKRNANLAVWASSKMIVWGGWDFPFDHNNGGVYTPWLLTPLEPSNLVAVADTFGVILNWQDNSDNEDGFIIERKDDSLYSSTPWVIIDTVATDVTAYNNIGLTPNTTYSYRISAYNEAGVSVGDSVEVTTIIPVELTLFSAVVNEKEIILNWATASELNNQGFEIEKQSDSWEKIGFVPGYGTTTEPKSYTFIDDNISSGTNTYRLKQIDYDGTFSYSKEVSVEVELTPTEYTLEQNYPNPFNPNTVIKYSLAQDGFVNIAVFNLLGEEVANLVNSQQKAGRYEIDFNAGSLSSGVYFYRLDANGIGSQKFSSIKKMILTK